MLHFLHNRLALIAGLCGLLLGLVFIGLVTQMSRQLGDEVRSRMIERSAAVLQPLTQQQFDKKHAEAPELPSSMVLVSALLSRATQEGLLAMAIFDEEGRTLEAIPAGPRFVDLPIEDFLNLNNGTLICRYRKDFPLSEITGSGVQRAPLLEVIVPVRNSGGQLGPFIGYIRYHLDARPLEEDLAFLDEQISQQTRATLFLGLLAVSVVTVAAQIALRRTHRQLAERNATLVRTQVELTLSAKASAMGQVTSHLMHALKGAVAGLKAATEPGETPDLDGIAEYTARVESMISETMEILGDLNSQTNYLIPSSELIRTMEARNGGAAQTRGITLHFEDQLNRELDNHKGSLLCLIANNLIQNAIEVCRHGCEVRVRLSQGHNQVLLLHVSDQGTGISASIASRLFQPGVSTRVGGSGLGLALSRLLARQMNGDLKLLSSNSEGTTFELNVPSL